MKKAKEPAQKEVLTQTIKELNLDLEKLEAKSSFKKTISP